MFIKRISSMVIISSLFLACAGVAAAQGPAGQMARLKRLLALTDAQATEISALLRKHREAAFPMRQELRTRNHELRNALEAPEPNPNAVGQLVIARHALAAQLRALNIKLQSDIAAVLTLEQKQKYEQLRTRRGPRRGPA